MFQVDAGRTICNIVRTLIDSKLLPGKREWQGDFSPNRTVTESAVILPMRAVVSYHDYDKDGCTKLGFGEKSVSRELFVLCSTVPHSHMTFGLVENEQDDRLWIDKLPVERWKFLSRHDSCWPDAIGSFFSEIYFDMCRKVTAHIPDEHRPAPVNLHHFHMLGNLGSQLWYPCEITYKKTGDYDYQILQCVLKE